MVFGKAGNYGIFLWLCLTIVDMKKVMIPGCDISPLQGKIMSI
jgi:hypothetical protein